MAVWTTPSSITLPYASRRHASWLDSENLRKKIWGPNPPGQEDPYGKEGIFDRRRREREEQGEQDRERGRELEPVPESEMGESGDQTEYVKATTAEGLETVGGPGWETRHWENANEENLFQGFGRLFAGIATSTDLHVLVSWIPRGGSVESR